MLVILGLLRVPLFEKSFELKYCWLINFFQCFVHSSKHIVHVWGAGWPVAVTPQLLYIPEVADSNVAKGTSNNDLDFKFLELQLVLGELLFWQ